MSAQVDQESSTSSASRATEYKKYEAREHIYKLPDTYVGSTEPSDENVWVIGEEGKMVQQDLTYIPALYKIFDEILVNAGDNKIRDPTMDTIKVTISDDGEISIYNNGKGIPVEIHPTENIYVPEMIFGNLLTSSSYGKEKKVVSSKNGYGAKLSNIFSTEFTVETYDKHTGLKYIQTWTNNMLNVGKPKVTKTKTPKRDYTQITFKPDLARFKLTHLDEDHRVLFKRRVYDLTASVRDVKVYFNGELIKIKSFKDYIYLYLSDDEQVTYEKVNERWEVAVAPNDSGAFQQVSFVNSIYTKRGGSHVDVVAKQITDKVMEKVKKITKGDSVKPYTIKNQMTLFINCLVEDPSFDSQTKETLTTPPKNWGSRCDLSDKFFDKVLKSKVVASTLEAVQNRQEALLKRTDGAKRNTITGIPKLEDANYAGTRQAHKCTLFLTEGDSAKSTAIAGISALPESERQYYGVYPLRGKVLNVRDASMTQVLQNKEITELKQILGLQKDKQYEDVKSLRYGKVVLFTDADTDGHHIKGLVLNFFDFFYPTLLKLGYISEFITPVVKCTKGNQIKSFYNLQEYETWRQHTPNQGKGWHQKYFKGAGTSTKKEAQDYFRDLKTHLKSFQNSTDRDSERLDMAFNKKRASDRKKWLERYDPDIFLDKRYGNHSVSDFIDKELVHFSQYDNIRSIPKVLDGLKPSQRKVLFSTFKRPIDGEIKVAQLGPRVAEMSAYHHGEVSLFQTIIKMAQDFTGSNNLNLYQPLGQFGTRRGGGSDAASPRYIFTKLQPYTRLLFHKDDDAILPKQQDDGMDIEPSYYLPIVPIAIVNGAVGIGSGYSTDVPSYNINDVINCLRARLDGQRSPTEELLSPWYKGFKGTITQHPTDHHKWMMRGLFTLNGNKLVITELPVGTWIDPYKVDHLEGKLLKEGTITDIKNQCTDDDVKFEITLKDNNLTEDQVVTMFKLETTVHTSNMTLFDQDFKLKRYESPSQIIDDYFAVRLDGYQKRKDHLEQTLSENLRVLHNKKRFIDNVVSGTLSVHGRPVNQVTNDLEQMEFDKHDGSFEYLLGLSLRSLTKERVQQLNQEYVSKSTELETLRGKTLQVMWGEDLDALESAL